MMERLLHTPEGVRDIYNKECAKKLMLSRALRHRINLYGFHDIQTPTFEFFDVFSKERGTVSSKDMYKFFDREGNTLVLRPDITPSIARCAASYFKEEMMPVRLCYCGNTFINNSSYQGKLKEITQLGAELLNDGSVEADAEIIALTVECLLTAGLKEFHVEIGQADFFKGLVSEAGFDDIEAEQLRILIEHKNTFAIDKLLSEKNISDNLKTIFIKLPEMFGTVAQLKEIKKLLNNERSVKAIENLENLYEILRIYQFEHYITFDLGMLSKYNYYTGIIFRAYTYGTGDAIADGGRYDSLLAQFGKDSPAIGMVIVIDQLMSALERRNLIKEPENENTLIVYLKEYRNMAVALAAHFRKQDMNIELYAQDKLKEISEYIAYAKRNGIGGILCLSKENKVDVIHIEDGSIQTAEYSDFEVNEKK